MAKLLIIFFFFISLITIIQIQATNGEDDDGEYQFVKALDQNPRTKVVMKRERLSHLRLYWHDIVSGKNPCSITVVSPPKTTAASVTGFGMVRMIDNPLTVGPRLGSRMVGRAQGFYASASQEEVGLLMTMNFAFVAGKYNGSTITVLGRNPVLSAVREMPVIGGSGLFRFARGYAQARTHSFDVRTGDAIVEYNVYVLHY